MIVIKSEKTGKVVIVNTDFDIEDELAEMYLAAGGICDSTWPLDNWCELQDSACRELFFKLTGEVLVGESAVFPTLVAWLKLKGCIVR